jgi:hypothetical protein
MNINIENLKFEWEFQDNHQHTPICNFFPLCYSRFINKEAYGLQP